MEANREVNSVSAKAQGAFLALAAGDALGWPQELSGKVIGIRNYDAAAGNFRDWTRRCGGRFWSHKELIRGGEYSDDTQLVLAVARSRTDYGDSWWQAFTRVELPFWTHYQRGGGGATRRAARAWLQGAFPWTSPKLVKRYFNAGGNGVAMRILPHVLFLIQDANCATLMRDVVRDGITTHGHPRALIGATAYAYAAWYLLSLQRTLRFGELLDALIEEKDAWGSFPKKSEGGNTSWLAVANTVEERPYKEVWENTVSEMLELLDIARQGLRRGAIADDYAIMRGLGSFSKSKGAGTVTCATATYLAARYASQPQQGILAAAFAKGADTDTLASMTGGLMGCLAGYEWLPRMWLNVQDAEYLKNIAARVAMGPRGAHSRPVDTIKFRGGNWLYRTLRTDGRADIGGSRQIQVEKTRHLTTFRKELQVLVWQSKAEDGQTLFVKEYSLPGRVRIEHSDSYKKVQALPVPKEQANVLYSTFCRELQEILRCTGALKVAEIRDRLGLVQSQSNTWLDKAVKDGHIELTQHRPKKYGLSMQEGQIELFASE